MKHIDTISRRCTPAEAMSTLEWAQVAAIVGSFVTAFNTFVTAIGNLIKIVGDTKPA